MEGGEKSPRNVPRGETTTPRLINPASVAEGSEQQQWRRRRRWWHDDDGDDAHLTTGRALRLYTATAGTVIRTHTRRQPRTIANYANKKRAIGVEAITITTATTNLNYADVEDDKLRVSLDSARGIRFFVRSRVGEGRAHDITTTRGALSFFLSLSVRFASRTVVYLTRRRERRDEGASRVCFALYFFLQRPRTTTTRSARRSATIPCQRLFSGDWRSQSDRPIAARLSPSAILPLPEHKEAARPSSHGNARASCSLSPVATVSTPTTFCTLCRGRAPPP